MAVKTKRLRERAEHILPLLNSSCYWVIYLMGHIPLSGVQLWVWGGTSAAIALPFSGASEHSLALYDGNCCFSGM